MEAIEYCGTDVVSLYQVIVKFNNLIFDLFKINIHKYPTLSSLAFAIYRTHFLKKDEIAQITGQIEKDIRQGYTGGAVDINLKSYEVINLNLKTYLKLMLTDFINSDLIILNQIL